jgi:hypothetical protein
VCEAHIRVLVVDLAVEFSEYVVLLLACRGPSLTDGASANGTYARVGPPEA